MERRIARVQSFEIERSPAPSPGEHKLNFIPAMIGPFLEVTLVPQPDLRNVMIPIFHDMMDWEQRRSGNFKQVRLGLMGKTRPSKVEFILK